ncbi:MAG: VWA domain-containing protein [Spirochaetia bacterium]|nr:VWA domain-containing protein [Spirochaetia bacterium]
MKQKKILLTGFCVLFLAANITACNVAKDKRENIDTEENASIAAKKEPNANKNTDKRVKVESKSKKKPAKDLKSYPDYPIETLALEESKSALADISEATEEEAYRQGYLRPSMVKNAYPEKSKRLNFQQRYNPNFNTEAYDRIYENDFLEANKNPLSTFSVDVDTASYSNVRRFLTNGSLPPKDAVRIEELINYFSYDYKTPKDNEKPFSVNSETSTAPWNKERKIVHIGIKGKEIKPENIPPRNLVFLLDVSGSMSAENKLPLLKKALKLLVQQLNHKDKVAIAVYAGSSGLVLPPTSGENGQAILSAFDRLQAGGSTNGGQGIELAYKTASEMFNENAVNRVILATDGDFNVGVTNQGDLTRLIEEKRKSGIFLTVLGFGMGNYKDSTMEKLADKGNGNYAYIDTFAEARKTLLEEAASTLITIAKDVKIQVEFNPALVKAYRLIGYENRMLKKEDFNDDKKDAGEIGAGHTVTALYEIVPPEGEVNLQKVDDLKYQTPASSNYGSNSSELLTVKIRYKEPKEEKSKLISYPVKDTNTLFENSSENLRFSAAVAGFGMLLRDSEYKGSSSFDMVYETAKNALGKDKNGYRAEFLRLVRLSQDLSSAVK